MSVTATAVRFARVQDGAAEYRRSTSPAPVANTVETLNDWTLKEDQVYGVMPPLRQRTQAAALRLELERLEAKGKSA